MSLTLALSLSAGAAAAGPLNFADVTSTRIVETVIEPFGEKHVFAGDFDNDGDLDVVVGVAFSDFGERTNELYRNDDGVFQEVTGGSIIPGFNTADVSRNAFFHDFDDDGWLDIYVVNDSNSGFPGGNDKLYMNNHPGGVFQSFVDETSTRLPSNGLLGASCASDIADFDDDGDMDIYLGNYPFDDDDRLLFNDGAGNFSDVTNGRIAIPGDYVVDVEAADMNGDGRIDVVVTNSHSNDGAYIQYNNNNNGAGREGDFSYANSTTALGVTDEENALEAGDFDGDGDLDLYWSNKTGNRDVVMENTGNDGNNKATWQERDILPPSVRIITSRKATVADLNDDGRADVFVMKETGGDGRPTVLRNTTVNGDMSFVDWTPASAFPSGPNHEGWHAQVFNADADADLEIFVGSHEGDHLFDRVDPATFEADDLAGGVIPGVHNGPATLVQGVGLTGVSRDFQISVPFGLVSVVLNAPGDCRLEIFDDGSLIATSDRGGLAVEEATQVNNVSGNITLRIEVLQSPADLNGDGVIDADDFFEYLDLFANGDEQADITGNGVIDAADFFAYLDFFVAGDESPFDLEVLARS